MISVYAPNNTDFSTIGDCILQPKECVIKETAGGSFTLELTHPVDSGNRWTYLTPDAVIKAPVPVRETPAFDESYKVYITTKNAKNIKKKYYKATGYGTIRNIQSTGGVTVSTFKPGDILYQANPSADVDGWVHVSCNGSTGYTNDITDLIWVTESTASKTQWVERTKSVLQRTISTQLFRIYEVKMDTSNMAIKVAAYHISYDLMGNLTNDKLKLNGKSNGYVKKYKVNTIVGTIEENMVITHAETDSSGNVKNKSSFNFYCNIDDSIVMQDYSWKNPVECLLDPDTGVVALAKAKFVRDNYDIFILENEDVDRGVYISYGKNLKGVTWTKKNDEVVTRIMPYYTDSKDNDKKIFYAGKGTIDSATTVVTTLSYLTHKNCDNTYDDSGDPVVPRVAILEVSLDDDTLDDKNTAGKTLNSQQKLFRAAYNEFVVNHCDQASLDLEVDFVQLGDTVEYGKYACLQQVYLYDTVRISHAPTGFKTTAKVKGYEWDCILNRYNKITLGDIFEVEGSVVASYQLGNSSVTSSKIATEAVGSLNLKDLAVTNAKIDNAAITTAKIDDLAVTNAKIQNATIEYEKVNTLFAGKITADIVATDTFSAEVAKITKAQIGDLSVDTLKAEFAHITDGAIDNAKIDYADINELDTGVMSAVKANIGTADIDWANIATLKTGVASIAQVEIGNADIDVAKIKVAAIENAQFANVVEGKVYINNLAVDDATIVSLTAGNLIIKDSEGVLRRLYIDSKGNVQSEVSKIQNADITDETIDAGEKIVEGSITASRLNATDIFANNANIANLIATNLDVASLTAVEGKVSSLTTAVINTPEFAGLDIASKKYVTTAVSDSENTTETKINQTSDNIRASVAAVSSRMETVETYLNFSSDGMDIGKSTSKFKMHLDDDELTFVEGVTEVASIKAEDDNSQASMLTIENARIGSVFRIGNFEAVIKNTNGTIINWYNTFAQSD